MTKKHTADLRVTTTSRWAHAAFSLIEIIIVVGLLSLITLGLFAMFSQTQRVFRAGLTQVDVLEGGRVFTEMLGRELQEIRPCYAAGTLNFFTATNFFEPLTQKLPGAGNRLNVIEDLYFLTRENQEWTGVGYVVSDPGDGIGSLYRYEYRTNATLPPGGLFASFEGARDRERAGVPRDEPGRGRVLDGVVHFVVRTYGPDGRVATNAISPDKFRFSLAQDNSLFSTNAALGEFDFQSFWSNAAPAYVEFEIGILEDRTRRRAESIPDTPSPLARRNFLAEQAGKVHVFRLRVPIRNVDSAAYQ